MVDAGLPDSTTLHIPERGVEGKLLAFIKDPARTPDKTTWFDFDRLLFNTGEAGLAAAVLRTAHQHRCHPQSLSCGASDYRRLHR